MDRSPLEDLSRQVSDLRTLVSEMDAQQRRDYVSLRRAMQSDRAFVVAAVLATAVLAAVL